MLKDEQAVTCQRRRDEHSREKEQDVQRGLWQESMRQPLRKSAEGAQEGKVAVGLLGR